MKKKIDEYGNAYIFSTDRGIEALCFAFIQCLKHIDRTGSYKIDLRKAAEYYIQNAPEDSMIFKRKPDLTKGNDVEDVNEWVNVCVDLILKTIKIQEKHIYTDFTNDKENENGVGYKIDENKDIYSYNILLPNTYLKMNQEDFGQMLNDVKISFDDLHCQQHYRMMNDLSMNKIKAKEKYPSFEIVKVLLEKTEQEKKGEEFSFSTPPTHHNTKSTSTSNTMSVFDNINTTID